MPHKRNRATKSTTDTDPERALSWSGLVVPTNSDMGCKSLDMSEPVNEGFGYLWFRSCTPLARKCLANEWKRKRAHYKAHEGKRDRLTGRFLPRKKAKNG